MSSPRSMLLAARAPSLFVVNDLLDVQHRRTWLTHRLPGRSHNYHVSLRVACSPPLAVIAHHPSHNMSSEPAKSSSSSSASPQEGAQPPPVPQYAQPPPYGGHYPPPPGPYPPFYAYPVPDPSHHDPNAPNGAPAQPVAPFFMAVPPPPPGMVYAYPMPPTAPGMFICSV